MFKRVSSVILLIMILSVLTSCYDAMEVDDEVYALTLGVDKGVNNKIRVTIQYPLYKSGEKSSGDNEKSNAAPNSIIHTVEASTVLGALDMYGMAISRRVSLMHTKVLVFSEEFARDGVGRYLAPIARFRETRRIMQPVVVRGTAEKFLKENQSNIGESLAKAIELMNNQADNTSFFPKTTFQNFYGGMLSPTEQAYTAYAGINDFNKLTSGKKEGDPPLVIDEAFMPGDLPRKGVAKREFVGTAVFDGDKMVGTLNSDETRYFLMVIGKFKRGIIDLEDENSSDNAIPLEMRYSRAPVIKGYFKNDIPVIDIKIYMEADIGAIQSRLPYEKLSMIEDLNRQAEKHIKKRVIDVIDKVQKEFKSDIFGFGHKFTGYFATIQEWEEYNWLVHFQETKINVEIDVNIERTGLMINSSPIRGTQAESNKED